MANHKLAAPRSKAQIIGRLVLEVISLALLYFLLAELASGIGLLPTILYGVGTLVLLVTVIYLAKELRRKRRVAGDRARRQPA